MLFLRNEIARLDRTISTLQEWRSELASTCQHDEIRIAWGVDTVQILCNVCGKNLFAMMSNPTNLRIAVKRYLTAHPGNTIIYRPDSKE